MKSTTYSYNYKLTSSVQQGGGSTAITNEVRTSRMGFNQYAFRTTYGLLKLLSLILIIVDLALARAGNGGDPLVYYLQVDHRWLVEITIGAFIIIQGVIFICFVFGEGMSSIMEAVFTALGTAMFIASGAIVIEQFDHQRRSALRSSAIALGSLCIVTGILFAVEFALLLKKILKK